VSVRAQSAPDAKVALDIPLFVARLSAKHFNSVWVCSFNFHFPSFQNPHNTAVDAAALDLRQLALPRPIT